MYLHKKISNIPVNAILAEGFAFRRDRKHNGFQLWCGGELIWDFPTEFMDEDVGGTKLKYDIYWNTHLTKLHRFLREYIDTPRDALDEIKTDYMGLRDILLAADKRRGRHVNGILMFSTNSAKARKVIHYRFRGNQRAS